MARQKPKPIEMSIHNCFESSVSEIESLREEMEQWKDNIEEYFSETEKYERINAAFEALDDGFNVLESWESNANGINEFDEEILQTVITVSQFKFTRRGLARWRRLSNSIVAIEVAKDWLEEFLKKADEDDREIPEDVKSSIEELIGLHDEAESHLSGVDFPTMFG